MKSLLKCSFTMAALVIMIGVAGNSAMATPVTYSTTGTFTGPGGAGNMLTIGLNTLTFTGTTDTANPTPGGPFAFTQFGSFSFANNNAGTVAGGVTFTLTITQVAPPGFANISAQVTGSVSTDGSTVFVNFGNNAPNFGPNTGTIGPFTYTPYNASINNFPLATTLNGRVDQAPTAPIPEPASMLLLGTGLAGVAGAVRRRLRARQQN